MGNAGGVSLAIATVVVATLLGCPGSGRGRPDFAPERVFDSPGPEGFCKIVDGALEVGVRNAGQQALAVTVAVDYPHGPTQTGVTPVIPEGEVRTAPVPIPTPIPSGDFSFVIRVDPDDAIEESNEDNNSAEGLCIT